MKILITILSSIGLSYAQVPTTSISNFNLNYSDPSGTASANHFIIPNYVYENSPKFTVEQHGGNFVLESEGEIFALENMPEQLLELEKVAIDNLNLETSESKLFLSVNQLSGNNDETTMNVKSVSVDCQTENQSENIKDEVLSSCVNYKGQIKIGRLSANGKDSLSRADFRFSRNGLNFTVKADGFNVKGTGKGYYTPGLLRIKIEKAKVGFLNVKNKLFKKLESIESEKVRVAKPWIEIDI